jgi:hypothetical protein
MRKIGDLRVSLNTHLQVLCNLSAIASNTLIAGVITQHHTIEIAINIRFHGLKAR